MTALEEDIKPEVRDEKNASNSANDVLSDLAALDPAYAREHSRQLFGSEAPPKEIQDLIDKFNRGEPDTRRDLPRSA